MRDPQLEETILSYVLNEKYTSNIIRITDDNAFPTHNKFWKYLKWYFNKYHKVPSLQVLEDAAARTPEAIPFYTLYKKLQENKIHDKDFAYFTEKFKDYDTAQKLLQACSDTLDDLKNNRGNAALQTLRKAILNQVSTLDDTTRDSNIIQNAMSRFEEYQKAKASGNVDLVPSGYAPLDAACGGFHKGELITVMAPTSGGKSAFLLNLGYNAWKIGKNVMYITLEMPEQDCSDRFDSRYTGIPYGKFVVKSMTVEDENLYKTKLEELTKIPNSFRIVDIPRGCTSAFLESKIANSLEGIDVLIVDYIGEMVTGNKNSIDWQDQAILALEMKQLARTYNIPLITAAQVTREGTQKAMFELHHMSRSWMIAQRSDICLGLVTLNDHEMQINVLKARKSAKFAFKTHCDFSKMLIEDLDQTIDMYNTEDENDIGSNSGVRTSSNESFLNDL